jgi:hypothetical protein
MISPATKTGCTTCLSGAPLITLRSTSNGCEERVCPVRNGATPPVACPISVNASPDGIREWNAEECYSHSDDRRKHDRIEQRAPHGAENKAQNPYSPRKRRVREPLCRARVLLRFGSAITPAMPTNSWRRSWASVLSAVGARPFRANQAAGERQWSRDWARLNPPSLTVNMRNSHSKLPRRPLCV